MKLAVPSDTADGLASQRSGHFGHCAYFTIVDIDDAGNIKAVESVKNVDHDQLGCGGVIDYVLGLGVDGILTVGMGRPPLMRFSEGGVSVYSERTAPFVGDAVKLFIAGQAAPMALSDACQH